MRHLLAIMLAGLVVAIGACTPAAPDRAWPAPSPALWEITSPDGHTGWLFGTIHALPEGAEWQTPVLEEALSKSGILVVEVADLADASEAARQFESRAYSADLLPLLQRVPESKRAALAAAIDEAGLSERAFSNTESWAAALQLANALRTYDSANGVDRALIDRFDHVVGLESLSQQFALFDELSAEGQAHLLAEIAREQGEAAQAQRVAAWLTGDLNVLARDAATGLFADGSLRDTLHTSRNRAWLGRIVELTTQGQRPFIAVGAAHMLGDDGLPALLVQQGYQVRRVQ